MTMLIAGHETTAAVLTWAVFFLAQVLFFTTTFRIRPFFSFSLSLSFFNWIPSSLMDVFHQGDSNLVS